MISAARTVRVVKMHGTHNVFAVLDERPRRFDGYAALARAFCAPDGPLGGADGLLVMHDAPGAAVHMSIYNADGGEAEMCGNGVRCIARYLWERGGGESFAIATRAGRVDARVAASDPFEADIDVGPVVMPRDARAESIELDGCVRSFYDVSVGNPHAVFFVDDVDAHDLVRLGTAAQAHRRFPHGTNVHLAAVRPPSAIRVRHFERGVGPTRACGTGAVACAAAAIAAFDASAPVTVDVPGGRLVVDFRGGRAHLRGPADTLFERDVAT